uniref:Inositol polyphosphate-related phosphatase domain-containing protein n=1 Tax=Rhodosorus marinus TaxID=101924 RepID=A0A7S3EIC1_9RHOD|mmetsp:Transcript_38057/g.151106  ORF Transcript_38057/g.151106 Transcript_38057/m.151106 type:complete len:800 (+) Transcript_38057:269-2668(+)|eukprot:CAMPEP_0113963016 /NCGR_PEP_ID=MMETSP0011_2-20120614/6264_1 /TAXON_ID=101924 /ORGANISM="Rhodosorus marinus" /LENGTH=799 /DNA_ID=CAMNT_0000974989 /DNA_START=151 /DNA_END=2553 /DNA_ORIENTATION=+ /assembly_acc=CAM_ASM_000156
MEEFGSVQWEDSVESVRLQNAAEALGNLKDKRRLAGMERCSNISMQSSKESSKHSVATEKDDSEDLSVGKVDFRSLRVVPTTLETENGRPSHFLSISDDNSQRFTFESRNLSSPGDLQPNSPGRDLRSFIDKDQKDIELLATAQGRRFWAQQQILDRRPEYVTPVSLKIFSGTWNVGGSEPEADLSNWLAADNCDYDVFAIGIEEVQPLVGMGAMTTDSSRGRDWTAHIEKTLRTVGDYVCVCARQMVGILLLVFVRAKHENAIKGVMTTEVGTGFMYKGGNKGAIASRMQIYESTFCFVACHLAAHQENVSRRNQDFSEVLRRIVFTEEKSQYSNLSALLFANENTISIPDQDLVVWLGDLNYRIDLPLEDVLRSVEEEDWESLLKHDQLKQALKNAHGAFLNFNEGEISFPPTYKCNKRKVGYDVGTESQTPRTPAWTDRILWKIHEKHDGKTSTESTTDRPENFGLQFLAQLDSYRRHEVFGSDHRPVSAVFNVTASRLDQDKRANVFSEIHRKLLPKLDLTPHRINLEMVQLGYHPVENIVLSNEGVVPVEFEVDPAEVPDWLTVEPLQGTLPAASVMKLAIKANLTRNSELFKDREYSVNGLSSQAFPLTSRLKINVRNAFPRTLEVESAFLNCNFLGSSLETMIEQYPSEEEHIPEPLLVLCKLLSRMYPSKFDASTPREEISSIFINLPTLGESVDILSASALGTCLLEVIRSMDGGLILGDAAAEIQSCDVTNPATVNKIIEYLPEPNRTVARKVFATFNSAFEGDMTAGEALVSAAARSTRSTESFREGE